MRTFKCKFELWRGRDKRASFNSAVFKLTASEIKNSSNKMTLGKFGCCSIHLLIDATANNYYKP